MYEPCCFCCLHKSLYLQKINAWKVLHNQRTKQDWKRFSLHRSALLASLISHCQGPSEIAQLTAAIAGLFALEQISMKHGTASIFSTVGHSRLAIKAGFSPSWPVWGSSYLADVDSNLQFSNQFVGFFFWFRYSMLSNVSGRWWSTTEPLMWLDKWGRLRFKWFPQCEKSVF